MTRPRFLDELSTSTPNDRNRIVDAARAGSILVVVVWHWTMSILQWNGGGALSMPNPIDSIPGGWLATWVLQIMPLFFVVGGYASMTSLRNRPRTLRTFLSERAGRLLRPLVPMVAFWIMADVLSMMLRGTDHRSVLEWGFVVFVPLWFIAVFLAVTSLAPLTVRLHDRAPIATTFAMAATVGAVDLLRFTTGHEAVGTLNVLAVFLFAHQLGYHWRDGTLDRWAGPMVVGAATILMLMVAAGPYPGSMVATESTAFSNMNPTTAPIAVVAVLQLGLTLWATPLLRRCLRDRRVWKAVITANVAAMTVFTWHMTALVLFVGVTEGMGLPLVSEATPTWWATRPIWFVGPGVVLTVIVFLVHRIAPSWTGLPRLDGGAPADRGRLDSVRR